MVTGVSDTPSRRKVFVCRPLSPTDEIPCARKIVSQLASQAYRRPSTNEDVESLMQFYADGRKGKDFEAGIKSVLQALLASPHFLFRLEEIPAGVRPGQNYRVDRRRSRVAALVLHLGHGPGRRAAEGRGATARCTRRRCSRSRSGGCSADPRGEAMSTRFASQWLRLQDVEKIHPDALLFPSFDNELAESYKRETELLFDSIVREDRNILDLFTADYTFINERIAKVYGIPNIIGNNFRRVPARRREPARHPRPRQHPDADVGRRSHVAGAARQVDHGDAARIAAAAGAAGSAPPPLEETKAVGAGGKSLTVRERMEEHRKNPACASCHKMIDPLGLALENFDVVGAWRIKDSGAPVDTAATLYDGTPISTGRQACARRSSIIRKR